MFPTALDENGRVCEFVMVLMRIILVLMGAVTVPERLYWSFVAFCWWHVMSRGYRHISTSGPSGLILSTDDYFYQKDGYHFEPTLLGAAHDWNQSRAKQAMLDGRTPVIIDNTNVQAWEMKPYVAVALETGYRVEFVEPDTSWKRDPVELEKRNHHGVSRETIANMLDRFEVPVSVDIVMNSCEPSHKRQENHSRPYRR